MLDIESQLLEELIEHPVETRCSFHRIGQTFLYIFMGFMCSFATIFTIVVFIYVIINDPKKVN